MVTATTELSPEERAAYREAIAKAVRENRSLNIYARKQYKDPRLQQLHLNEERNYMGMGIPGTMSLWDNIDPAFEISNRIPWPEPLASAIQGEVNGLFNRSIPDKNKESPSIGLNLNSIGNNVLIEMLNKDIPIQRYQEYYKKAVYDTLQHEREHTYTHAKSPFTDQIEFVNNYLNLLPKDTADEITKLGPKLIEAIASNEPETAKLYNQAITNNPKTSLGLFEEVAARAGGPEGFGIVKDDRARELLQNYVKWKRIGLFE